MTKRKKKHRKIVGSPKVIPLKRDGLSTQKKVQPIVLQKKPRKISKGKIFWEALALISFLIAILTFYPKTSVDPGESTNPYDPFRTPLIIKNEGRLPIWDIECEFMNDSITTISGMQIKDNVIKFTEKFPRLNSNKSLPIFLTEYSYKIPRAFPLLPNEIKSAEISINITYKPFWLLLTLSDKTRFRLIRKQNGEYRWLKHPEK